MLQTDAAASPRHAGPQERFARIPGPLLNFEAVWFESSPVGDTLSPWGERVLNDCPVTWTRDRTHTANLSRKRTEGGLRSSREDSSPQPK